MTSPRARIVHPEPDDEFLIPEGCLVLEAWNCAEDPDVSIARARVTPGTTTRPHRLRGVQERYLIVSGEGRVAVGTLAPAPVGPGDVVVIPPGQSQSICNTGTQDLVFYAICTPRFTPECYEEIVAG